MSKINNQLQELLKQKKQLVTNLNAKGVSASQEETLNTLVPKVMSIVGGTGDVKLGTKEITKDGNYYAYADGLDGYSSLNVNVLGDCEFTATFTVEGATSTYMNIKMLGDVPEYGFNGAKLNEADLSLSKTIAGNGFYNNSTMTNIIAPNPLIVGTYAFSGCSNAEGEITVSEEQTEIQDSTFRNCQKLKINIHDKITSIGSYAFYYCYLLDLTSLPSLLEFIGTYAFRYCTGLKITELPIGITSVSTYAFANCTGIETLKIHDAITSISAQAFRYCSGLKELEIGKGMTSMSTSYCFGNCTALEKITIHATTPPNLASNAFYQCNNLKVVEVPASALEEYKTKTNWTKYADIMVGIEGE